MKTGSSAALFQGELHLDRLLGIGLARDDEFCDGVAVGREPLFDAKRGKSAFPESGRAHLKLGQAFASAQLVRPALLCPDATKACKVCSSDGYLFCALPRCGGIVSFLSDGYFVDSQSRTVVSLLAEATMLPSRLKAT